MLISSASADLLDWTCVNELISWLEIKGGLHQPATWLAACVKPHKKL